MLPFNILFTFRQQCVNSFDSNSLVLFNIDNENIFNIWVNDSLKGLSVSLYFSLQTHFHFYIRLDLRRAKSKRFSK